MPLFFVKTPSYCSRHKYPLGTYFYTCRVGGMNQDSFPVFNGYTVQFNSGIPSRSKSVVLSRFWFS